MRLGWTAAMVAAALGTANARANEVSFAMDNPRLHVELTIREKQLDDDGGSEGTLGAYVFVASALPDGELEAAAIEEAARCTGLRPRVGVTKATVGGFGNQAYAAYYGPYGSRQDAAEVLAAVKSCVGDAFVSTGVMQRL